MIKTEISKLANIFTPSADSHKGQNGRLLIIGGSRLFHAASLWSLEVASRIVDLVHYSSVKENNQIVRKLKEEFRNGIIVERKDIENYILEDDCVLIGPGMVRAENEQIQNSKEEVKNLKDIISLDNEGLQTYYLTRYLLEKYPFKKWVIDAGALQMLKPEFIPPGSILTPHKREFETLYLKSSLKEFSLNKDLSLKKKARLFAEKYHCTLLIKGSEDIIVSEGNFKMIKGGNSGMTKGGTGDVLAGLVSALFCKNNAYTSVKIASYVNKKAGEDLFEKKGYWFNASDLSDQIPETMKRIILSSNSMI